MDKRSANYYIGLTLVVLGVLYFIASFISGTKFWALFWPVFILLPGFFLFSLWQRSANKRKFWGLLIPSTILMTYAATFFFNMIVTVFLNYPAVWGWTAFMYIWAVALAFWFSWVVTGTDVLKAIARILNIISLSIFLIVGFFITIFGIIPKEYYSILSPMILILVGILIIFGPVIMRAIWRDNFYFGKTEQEWREWGENFAKQFEDKDGKK